MGEYSVDHPKTKFDSCCTKRRNISCITFHIKAYVALFRGFFYNILPKGRDYMIAQGERKPHSRRKTKLYCYIELNLRSREWNKLLKPRTFRRYPQCYCSLTLLSMWSLQPTVRQKQHFADVFHNRCSSEIHNIHRKATVLESFLNKVAGLRVCRFIKNRLQHRYFPVNIAKTSRKAFYIDHLRW